MIFENEGSTWTLLDDSSDTSMEEGSGGVVEPSSDNLIEDWLSLDCARLLDDMKLPKVDSFFEIDLFSVFFCRVPPLTLLLSWSSEDVALDMELCIDDETEVDSESLSPY